MPKKLVTEILEYNRDNNLFLSVDQVEKLFYYLAAHYNLKDYAKDISFYKNPPFWGEDAVAEYYLAGKEMIRISKYFDIELSYMWEGGLLSIIKPQYTPSTRHVISPYERFIKVRNRILTLDEINWRELDLFQLPLDKRLSYGLPITRIEYKEMEGYIRSIH